MFPWVSVILLGDGRGVRSRISGLWSGVGGWLSWFMARNQVGEVRGSGSWSSQVVHSLGKSGGPYVSVGSDGPLSRAQLVHDLMVR